MMNTFSLTNKIAVVTGANGKLGTVWVKALAQNGAKVIATDMQSEACHDIAQLTGANTADDETDVKYCGGSVAYYGNVDITSRADTKRLNTFCKETFGTVNILVNNAGVDQPPAKSGSHYTIEDYPEDVFKKILEVNAFGTFVMIQEFGTEMANAGGGSIINIGSLYAAVSPDEKFYTHLADENGAFIKPPSYGMSKAAVINLTKYLAAHWGKHNIRVNTLSPGGVEGGQDSEFKRKFCDRVPLGRMAVTDDLTGPLVFLASDASRYITGTELRVDGGFTAW